MGSAQTTSVPAKAFRLEPFAYAEARLLARELDISEPVAVTLVRRGYTTVEAAQRFLDAAEHHDPTLFSGMDEAAARLREAVARGRRITVHGDYDADGVCSTTILVSTLRALGAECDWYIPDRMGDGYGLTAEGVERLAARGTQLLLTADCGVTCAAEVGLARERGIEVIVTDHHQPGDELPDCPIIHPEICGYPCPDLCAAGVAYKLAAALRGEAADADLDLVALATVADLVALTGENRALVRRGLETARRGRRPGLRALAAVARIELERLDEGDLAFRLAPRINAAGRLYRADAGVELMLTGDEERARAIAEELDRANRERREAEREVLTAAEQALRELPPEVAEAPGVVLAGKGWHPGVVGICASRLVEQLGRPVLLVSLDDDGNARGSGRSVPGYDLLEGLRACAEELERFGGHRAAAGLELRAERIPALREAFAEHVRTTLGDTPQRPPERIDAVVATEELGMSVAGELARLGPFGKGNPPVRLVVPAARIRDIRAMGEGDRHARFSLEGAGGRARGVAFGVNGALEAAAQMESLDVSVALELNHWNGAVEPRVVLGEVYAPEGTAEVAAPAPSDDEWHERVAAELSAPLEPCPDDAVARGRRAIVDRRGHSGVAAVATLASSGEPVLVVSADAYRRRGLLERAVTPMRFGGAAVALAPGAGGDEPARHAAATVLEGGGVVLADWARLERDPDLPSGFSHVVLIDPPPLDRAERSADACAAGGFLHLAWGPPDAEFALRSWRAQWPSRPALAALYRALRDAADAEGRLPAAAAAAELRGRREQPRAPEVAARAIRVMRELGVVEPDPPADRPPSGIGGGLRVVSSGETDLARSPAFTAYRARCEEGERYLSRRKQA